MTPSLLSLMKAKLDYSGISPLTRLKVMRLLREAINEQTDAPAMTDITPEEILNTFVRATGIPKHLLLGRKRLHHIAAARHVCMFLIRAECGYSLKNTGLVFKRDHTTVIHACDRVRAYLKCGDALVTRYYSLYNQMR